MGAALSIPFDNSYARLPPRFFERVAPTRVAAPRLLRLNRPLAAEMGLDPDRLAEEEGAAIFAGNRLPEGAEPLAMAYAGHQFGQFVPQLGDGRAILLGEVIDRAGRRRDIQLKGAGLTRFSRRGDGRAALGPVLREYLIGEAMAAFSIPTSRALAAVATGEPVYRETTLPGAVLTRIASSHLRIGSFQYFAAQGDQEAVRILADYAIARHYPPAAEDGQPVLALLEQVTRRQAALIAQWLLVGFIHGVMNTDNMTISGETIDYGPCAFLDSYDPAKVFSSIDDYGRYAYGRQPRIAQWNLARLAECLLPLIAEDESSAIDAAEAALDLFPAAFERAYEDGLRRKLGLATAQEGDLALARQLLNAMAAQKADFTLTFRRLCSADSEPGAAALRALFADPTALDAWLPAWRARLEAERRDPAERRAAMRQANPAVIPRNHLVEEAISAAVEQADLGKFDSLLAALADPYDERPDDDPFTLPAPQGQEVYRTFCGT
jgi:uncharacterized protein YdiU (UPF0061 family)